MSFVLNEAGLQELFHGPAMRRFIEGEAEKVTAQAQQNAGRIMHRSNVSMADIIGFELLDDDDSVYAKIGVLDPNRKIGGYLDEKEQREHGWLTPALTLEGLRPR